MAAQAETAADSSGETSWWSRRGGGREVAQVSAPLVISSLSWTIMTFVDRMYLNWWSGEALAAAFTASVAWWAVVCLPMGLCGYANTFVAQYYGAKELDKIGVAVWQAVWVAIVCSPVVLLFIPRAPTFFGLAEHPPQVLAYEIEYFQILLWGGPPLLIAAAACCFYSGRGETKVVMLVDAGTALLNVVLDYWWIFGGLGLKAYGVAGAGWATVASIWVKAIIYLALMWQRKYAAIYGTHSGLRFDRDLFGRLFYFGGPSGLQMLLDVAGFTIFTLLVGRLGSVESQATSIAFSVGTLAFMPIIGIGIGASILVGQHLGENNDHLAARSTYSAAYLAWGYMALISLLYLFTPQLLLEGFFATKQAAESGTEVRELAAHLMKFVAAYNLFDATFIIFSSAIKGAGDTRFVFYVSLVLAIALATLSYQCVEVWQSGLNECWLLITAWIWIAAITFFLRFRQGKWRSMRVIELPAVLHVDAAI